MRRNGLCLLGTGALIVSLFSVSAAAAGATGAAAEEESRVAGEAPGAIGEPGSDTKLSMDELAGACALLDDPQKRALMDGLLLKLLVLCGRSDELGEVRQTPRLDVGEPDAGTDVAVNDPSGDTGSSTTQSETSLAVSETTGTICSAFNDSYQGVTGQGYSGFARSTDGGATFNDGGGFGGGNFGDPSMVWRRADESFYYAALGDTGLRIYRSADDCQTFQLLGNIHNGYSDDKELMAVDNTTASAHYGNLYVVWTNFSSDGRIWATRSIDGGVSWGSTQSISSSTNVQGAWPAVAPDGTVYAAWVEFGAGTMSIRGVRSTDGGVTWAAIAAPAVSKVQPRDSAASGTCGRAALRGNIRYLPSPQLAVGGDGVLHVVYSYDPDSSGSGDTVNVYYRRSTDGGTTWEPEVLVNDDGTTQDQFFPTLSVGAGNVVSVAWYDRRNDPGNMLVDYYQRLSYDGGATWEPSVRLSDVSTPIHLDGNLATCYHGDYDTQVQTETTALMQWSDDRRVYAGHNDPDVYLDTMSLCLLTIAPPTASAGVGGDNLIQVGWDDSATPEISEYRVLRSFDAGGPYELVTTVPDASPGVGGGLGYTFSDSDVSGGTEYFYVVRSSDGGPCLSGPSDEVSAVATGACTLAPMFDGVQSVVNPATAQCALQLSWTAASSRCGGSVTYNVYRSIQQGFVPSPASLVAGGIAETTHIDDEALASGARHYYVVRSVDSVNAAEDQNLEELSAVPTGPYSVGTWLDDAGDTGETKLIPEQPWSVSATGGNLGPAVYLTGAYGNQLCAGLASPPLQLGSAPLLAFWSRYEIESGWDKGVVEISTDGGISWDKVPVDYPGSSSQTSDACGLPAGSFFTGTDGTAWAQYGASLATWADQEVILRWSLSTDVSVTYDGWWIDDVAITDVMVPGSCQPVTEPPLFADGFESGDTGAWSSTAP